LEEIMNKHSIAMGLAALAFGALAAVPASAQNYGRNPNDGGLVQAQGGDYYPPQKPTAQSSAPAYYGRPLNDGGMVQDRPAQRQLYNSAPQKTPTTPPHYGRPMNDGGS
jgi:hypothetical protein